MRHFLLSSILIAIPFTAAAEIPAEIYTIDRAIKSAVNNNAAIQTAEKGITIAEQRVKEARLRFLPDVGLQATATRYNSRYPFALRAGNRSLLLFPSDHDYLYSGQAYLSIPLYDGQRNINTLRLAQTSLKQARARYDAIALDIIYRTKEVFHRFLLAQKMRRATEELVALAEKLSRDDGGNPWQKVEAEAIAVELRAARSEARHKQELARLDFLKGLNLELDRSVRLDGRLETHEIDVDLRKALVWATELRPELQSQTYRAQMDAIGVNLTLSRRYPTLALGIDYELTGQEFPLRQNNWDATFGIRLPFSFDFWTQHNQKLAEQRQAEIKRAELRDQVHLEVRKAHREMMYWQDEWQHREREYRRLEALLKSARGRAAPAADALRASSRVLDAHKRYLQAITEHILARARLERAIGRPLSGSL